MQLIAEPAPGRYALHDLLRAYAAELSAAIDTEAQRLAATGRLVDHYRLAAAMATDAAYPGDRRRRPPVPPANADVVVAAELADPAQALAWLDAELPNLLAAARHAAGNGWAEHAWHLSVILHGHLRGHGRARDAETLHGQALATARAAGDRLGELNALIGLGQLHWLQGRHDAAIDHFTRAAGIARAAGDPVGGARALNGLGWLAWFQGRDDEALAHFQPALRIARASGHGPGEADALTGLGWVHFRREEHGSAGVHFEQSHAIARSTGHGAGELMALQGICYVHLSTGEPGRARDGFLRCLELARAIRHRDGELYALLGLGDAYRAEKDFERAELHFREAGEFARRVGNHYGEQRAQRALAELPGVSVSR